MDKELVGRARTGSAEDYLALLTDLVARDEQAQAEAKRAREALDLAIAIALHERPEVHRGLMAKITGIPYRALYKRGDRGYGEDLSA